ncbi:hypothetical protein NSS71_08505 [Niallia sp. FSL W8-0951]|uniref:hypothetical protein n=1 Tax=unclassified Niallia TaxID=2837522 RepID=UPI0030F56EF0
MNQIEVLRFNNQEDYDQWLDNLNQETRILMNKTYRYYINECSTTGAKEIFRDWWNGTSISNEEYKNRYSKEDYKQAEDCVLEACSRGFG